MGAGGRGVPCRYVCWAPNEIGIDIGIIKRYIQWGILLVALLGQGESAESIIQFVWLKSKK